MTDARATQTTPRVGPASRITGAASRLVGGELTLRLVRDRYDALNHLRTMAGGGDWFPLRMLGRPALVVRGEAGVRTFYDPELVTRRGAVPAPIRLVLFGPGAVHGLNGPTHTRRKGLLLSLVDSESTARLTTEVAERLDRALSGWQERSTVQLFDELARTYGEAVLTWAGTGIRGQDALRVTLELAAMVDGFALGGTSYPRAALARVRSQRWALDEVKDVREGRRAAPAGSALASLAATPRKELPDIVAATELLNVVRPTVAVTYFGAYAAHALDMRPEWRPHLAEGSPRHLRAFEHEIRRWYPFTPLLTGRLQRSYHWGNREYRRGDWMVLDVMGTNHDPQLWEDPAAFRPERFLDREPTAFDYVPHGGGDPAAGHRCPGEPLAVGILGATIQRLATIEFELSEQGRQVPLDRMPSLPPDGMTLHNLCAASSR